MTDDFEFIAQTVLQEAHGIVEARGGANEETEEAEPTDISAATTTLRRHLALDDPAAFDMLRRVINQLADIFAHESFARDPRVQALAAQESVSLLVNFGPDRVKARLQSKGEAHWTAVLDFAALAEHSGPRGRDRDPNWEARSKALASSTQRLVETKAALTDAWLEWLLTINLI